MSDAVTVEELDGQIAMRRARFSQVIADIGTILTSDIDGFVQRAVKAAYLNKPDASSELTAAQVGELKAGAQGLGARATAALTEALADESAWLASDAEPENTKALTAATGVWQHVTAVEAEINTLLGSFGLAGEAPVTYRAPTYFVGGLFLPSLTEHYWRLIAEMKHLEAQKKKLADDALRESLESKWDNA